MSWDAVSTTSSTSWIDSTSTANLATNLGRFILEVPVVSPSGEVIYVPSIRSQDADGRGPSFIIDAYYPIIFADL